MFRSRKFIQSAVYGKVIGGGGGPTLTFIGQNTYSPTNNPNTISSVNIGTASANRRVIIACTIGASYNPITAITIGGISCTLNGPTVNSTVSYDGQICFGYADVTTGTTATIVITGGDQLGDSNQDTFYIYTVDKSTLANGSPTYSGATLPSSSLGTTLTNNTTNTSASGFVITALSLSSFRAESAMSITASTETYATDGTTSGGQTIGACASKKSGSAANAPTSVTWSWTTAGAGVVGVYAWS